LINANQLLKFPLLPKRIAVISADTSKGLSDFNQVLAQNDWGYTFFQMLFPSYLQGDLAARSIISALQKIEKVKEHFDIVVIVRGGGGEVGLSCYNNYNLCKEIASFPLPVLTGIGHSTNLTVAEMIAYRNAITPTELGEFLIQAFHNFSVPLKDAVKALRTHSLQIVSENKHLLNRESVSLNHVTNQRVKQDLHFLSGVETQIKNSVKFNLLEWGKSMLNLKQELNHCTHILLNENKGEMRSFRAGLKNYVLRALQESRTDLNQLEQSVKLMDPVNVLKRGFTITTFNGQLIRDVESVNKGDTIETISDKHILLSEVQIKKGKENG